MRKTEFPSAGAIDVELPLVAPIRQIAPQSVVQDVTAETRRLWQQSRFIQRIKPGDRVAVGVGSRGIANIAAMTRATLAVLQQAGAKPFVVAAMGSHGGATPAGQRELLAEYGVSEEQLGVEVKTDMTAVQIGTNSWNEPVWWDANALAADHVVTISRIKPHTDFRGKFESGIGKMLVIGLGKRDGASQHHRWGFKGLRDMLPETLKVVLEKTPFAAGLAVLENANEETGKLQIVEREEVLTVEPQLLEEARVSLLSNSISWSSVRSARTTPVLASTPTSWADFSSRRSRKRERRSSREFAAWISRPRVTATAPGWALPISPPNDCSTPSTPFPFG
jgi:hypothetical protein